MDEMDAGADESSTDAYEYVPLRIGGEVDPLTAQARLSVAAEYGGWELARVARYPGGERKVTLRRRRTRTGIGLPGLSY
ncbi:DUF5703 family protein [Actinorhabdospora filicis]|nr:DUF5703 family protein [Actinorhabdospora filicis]